MAEPKTPVPIVELASDVVSAFVAKNRLPVSELPGLLQAVYTSFASLSTPPTTEVTKTAEPQSAPAKPAVSVKKSITPDYLVCLEDGRRFKSLRRHLRNLGLTPEQYRTKWKLPNDYPMVAPNYAAARSALAKSMGLGQKAKGRGRTAKGPKA